MPLRSMKRLKLNYLLIDKADFEIARSALIAGLLAGGIDGLVVELGRIGCKGTNAGVTTVASQ